MIRESEVQRLIEGAGKFRMVVLIDDHGGGAKLPMFGDGKHRIEFVLRQSRQKAGPKLIGKTDSLVSEREFADTIHKISLFIAFCAILLGTPYPIFHHHLGQTTVRHAGPLRMRCLAIRTECVCRAARSAACQLDSTDFEGWPSPAHAEHRAGSHPHDAATCSLSHLFRRQQEPSGGGLI